MTNKEVLSGVVRELEIMKKSNERIIAEIKKNGNDLYRRGYVDALKQQNWSIKNSIKCYRGVIATPF